MPRYVISTAPDRDIESILVWTHERFGPSVRLRYEAFFPGEYRSGPIDENAPESP